MRIPSLIILGTLILFLHFKADAQKQNNVWCFGHYAGLDFNTNPPTPFQSQLYTLEGNASISDSGGNLLFYTDGDTVWDRSHHVMPNGIGLQGGESSTQAALIVPLPGSYTKYYLFTTGDYMLDGGMAYSVIDMALHNGYGDIVSSTKNTFVLDSTGEMLTAILHSNGTDIWIITHTINSTDFYAYLLSSAGLAATPLISSIGSYHTRNSSGSFPGPIRNSHDGSKIVCSITYGGICDMFDFNSSNGSLSHFYDLRPLIDDQNVYGIEFSPNDSLLYLAGFSINSDANLIRQISLYEDPPLVAAVAFYPGAGEEYGALQMGPDNKIYLARRLRSFIDVIHAPDKVGAACQYEAEGLMLLPGTPSTYGLPNPAPYSFCPNITVPTDTTICDGDSIRLAINLNSTVDCPQSITWYDGTSDTVKTFTHPGIYWVAINNSITVYIDSIRIDSAFRKQITATICDGESHEGYVESGTYIDTFSTSGGCDSIRTLYLTVNHYAIDTFAREICKGDSYEGYNKSGIYTDTFPNPPGCPFIRILRLNVIDCLPIIAYDLNACESVMANGSHMDYSEFTPAYPSILPCADVNANYLYRNFPQKHSCTPGFNGSPAMCVTVFDSCGYQAGNPASVIIEFTIDPPTDSIVQFTGLTFYEKGPLDYNWINGPSGINNFPYYFGLRILKNGTEIYRRSIIHTNLTWTLQTFDFVGDQKFSVDSVTHFRIELLPYCPAVRGADVSAWDIDEISVYAGCISPLKENPVIDGFVFTKNGQPIPNANIYLSDNSSFSEKLSVTTNEDGYYIFNSLEYGKSYFLKGYKNDDVLNGVNVLDLIRIQKHLLGIEPLTTLDQFVAADINRSGSISVLDLVELQKVLLGKYVGFPRNTSWRFGVLPQDFTGIDLSTFQEIKSIENLNNSQHEVNFLGVEIGDLK